MTVAENVGYGLKVKGVRRRERSRQVDEVLRMVRLDGYGERKPVQLSGGQRQRVALARSIVNQPKVLLLDEPLGALDLKLRQEMQVFLKALQRDLGMTFIYVTHDQEEALTMSDRIAVFNAGQIEQVGTPAEVYERPATEFVAGFVGTSNILERNGRRFTIRPEKIRMLEGEQPEPGMRVEPGKVSGRRLPRRDDTLRSETRRWRRARRTSAERRRVVGRRARAARQARSARLAERAHVCNRRPRVGRKEDERETDSQGSPACTRTAAGGLVVRPPSPSGARGSGSKLDPTSIGKGEGSLNLIEWSAYSDPSFAKKFEQQTGCTIHRKDAGTSDEMVALMRSGGGGGGGQYDLVSASGDASLRLIYGGDLQPVNVNLIPTSKDFLPAFKSPAYNTVNGVHYGISLQWGPNTLIYNTKKVSPAPTGWASIYDPANKGLITVPDNPIQIADAALYLQQDAAEPQDHRSVRADADAVRRGGQAAQGPAPADQEVLGAGDRRDLAVPERRRDGGRRLAVPDHPAQARRSSGRRNHPDRRRDRMGRHVDAGHEGAAPQLRVHVDEVREHPQGPGDAGPLLR